MTNENSPQGLSILIIDDNPDMLILLAVLLRREKYTVDFASNGMVALEKLHANHYDVMITDLDLPYISGRKLLEKLEKDEILESASLKSMAIILCTAMRVPDDLAIKADGVIMKPPDPEHVIDVIKSAFYKKRYKT